MLDDPDTGAATPLGIVAGVMYALGAIACSWLGACLIVGYVAWIILAR